MKPKATEFWAAADELVRSSPVHIDRPAGTPHKISPNCVYPLDYGFLADTRANDGAGVDVWLGSGDRSVVTAAFLTVDSIKKDAEVKFALGCTEADLDCIADFFRSLPLPFTLVRR